SASLLKLYSSELRVIVEENVALVTADEVSVPDLRQKITSLIWLFGVVGRISDQSVVGVDGGYSTTDLV
ncbi:hypothetical protein A2U01_0076609, partial [Trifolium medium]|nr:hypothetical protein [Trifolium medium]